MTNSNSICGTYPVRLFHYLKIEAQAAPETLCFNYYLMMDKVYRRGFFWAEKCPVTNVT
jgi:hypothetical protein